MKTNRVTGKLPIIMAVFDVLNERMAAPEHNNKLS